MPRGGCTVDSLQVRNTNTNTGITKKLENTKQSGNCNCEAGGPKNIGVTES